jgi:hypothetical protein
MGYFISPPEETDWKIDVNALCKAISLNWSKATIEIVNNPNSLYILTWSMEINTYLLDGTLTKDRNVVYLDGDIRACAIFALWFRQQVPSEQKLIFYDEGYSCDIVLSQETSEVDLIQTFLCE